MGTDSLFDLDTDLVLSQVPEVDLSQEWSTPISVPVTLNSSQGRLSLKGKQKFCVHSEDKLAKNRFNPPVSQADIKKIQDEAIPRNTKKIPHGR